MLFCFNDTATTEICTLSLHDALPICVNGLFVHMPYSIDCRCTTSLLPKAKLIFKQGKKVHHAVFVAVGGQLLDGGTSAVRSEEHTSELQSRQYLVCRLLLEKTTSLPH